MFEDPYSTLKSQSLFRSRPLYQDMLGLSFCMGNTWKYHDFGPSCSIAFIAFRRKDPNFFTHRGGLGSKKIATHPPSK